MNIKVPSLIATNILLLGFLLTKILNSNYNSLFFLVKRQIQEDRQVDANNMQ
jgi:hypothetical protein